MAWSNFRDLYPASVFGGDKDIRPKHFQLPNCPIGPTLQKYRFILRPPWQSIEETAMAGPNFRDLYPPVFSAVTNTYGQSIFSFQIDL